MFSVQHNARFELTRYTIRTFIAKLEAGLGHVLERHLIPRSRLREHDLVECFVNQQDFVTLRKASSVKNEFSPSRSPPQGPKTHPRRQLLHKQAIRQHLRRLSHARQKEYLRLPLFPILHVVVQAGRVPLVGREPAQRRELLLVPFRLHRTKLDRAAQRFEDLSVSFLVLFRDPLQELDDPPREELFDLAEEA